MHVANKGAASGTHGGGDRLARRANVDRFAGFGSGEQDAGAGDGDTSHKTPYKGGCVDVRTLVGLAELDCCGGGLALAGGRSDDSEDRSFLFLDRGDGDGGCIDSLSLG